MLSTSDEQFARIVADAKCYADIARSLGLRVQGFNYQTFKRRIARQGLLITHFNAKAVIQAGYQRAKETLATPLSELLVDGYDYSSNRLKQRLVEEGLLVYRCKECGNDGEWNGKSLILQLDHQNGNHKDNRIENLRILCPNCHTQTGTHSGKRFKGTGKSYTCSKCGRPCSKQAHKCQRCQITTRISGFTWPEPNVLQNMLWTDMPAKVAQSIGCCYALLRKHCLQHGITLPGHGYWLRRKYGKTHEEALQKPPEPVYRHMTDSQLERAKVLAAQGASYREIGKELNLCHTTISRRLNGVNRSRKMVPQP